MLFKNVEDSEHSNGFGIENSLCQYHTKLKKKGLKAKGFNLVQSVNDEGTNLIKALKMSEIPRVSDCTHAIGNLLKKQYHKDEHLSFSKQCGVLKRQVFCVLS